MSEPPGRSPQEGDELWLGLVGPIRVSDETTPEREAWNVAGRIAQAAHSLDDLAGLVATHPDPKVRYQAMPRLRARFPAERQTLDVLIAAADHPDAMVREGAVMALGDLHEPEAADAVARRLHDEDFDVRLEAAQTLLYLGDHRAPDDPEAWALQGMVEGTE
jgi:HEAT repeat protein